MNYRLYRLKNTKENAQPRFMGSSYLHLIGRWPPNPEAYEKIYEGTINASSVSDALDSLFSKFNVNHPEDFRGYSMSTGDIVVLTGENPGAHFCDPFGWVEIPEFFAAVADK